MFRSVQSRVVALFVAAMALVIAATVVVGFRYLHWYEHTITDYMGRSAADSCKGLFDVMAIDDDDIMTNDELYGQYRETLRDVCKATGAEFLYAFHCDESGDTITYLMCVARDDERDEQMRRERGRGTVVEWKLVEEEERALAGEVVPEGLLIDNQFGTTLAWYNRVDGWDGRVIAAAEYLVSDQRERVMNAFLEVIPPIVAILIILMFVQLYVLRKQVFKPLRTIDERLKSFSAEDAGDFEPLGIKSQGEIGKIASTIETMAADIAVYVGDIKRMTAERVQADVELDVARRIQLGMVPERMAGRGAGYDVVALSHPARTVGGDFYDIVLLDNGCIAIVVGDVSGKGVAAALFMAMAKTMIRDGLLTGEGPAETLNSVNDRICAENPEGMFVTVGACVFDPATGEVRLANAGHMPPLLVGEDTRLLETDPGVLLGLFEDANLEESTIVLEYGQGLVLYTDGVTEAVNADREFFGEDRLIACVEGEMPYSEVDTLADAIVRSLLDFVGDGEQFDDITGVALMRCAPDEGAALPSEAGSRPSARSESYPALPMTEVACDMASFSKVKAAVFALDIDDGMKRMACLACEELFANIVMYSGASFVAFGVGTDEDGVRVTFEDDGVAFDPTAARPPEKDFEELDSGGMGIALVRQISTSMTYYRSRGRNVLNLSGLGSMPL